MESPELDRFLREERARVDRELARRLEGSGALRSAMRYSALAPGKRMRPLAAIAVFRACGGDGEAIYGPASALELIHAYSLVHDDLPDFDDDAVRRGRPASHVVHGEPLALAAGFGLLAEGLAWVGEQPPALACDLLRVVTRSIGLDGMVGGQYLDLVSEGRELGAEDVFRIHTGKTGRLIRAAVLVGAIMAGADAQVRAPLARYGEHLGLAFQIADDLLDAVGDERVTGKPARADAAAGKATFVSVYGADTAREHALAAARVAKLSLEALPIRAPLLEKLADFVAERTH